MKTTTIIIGVCAMLAASIAASSCDPHHEYPDTSMKAGHIVWADGSVSPASEGLNLGKTPVAVIYRLNYDLDGYGIAFAVSIDEFESMMIEDPLVLPSDAANYDPPTGPDEEAPTPPRPPQAQGTSTDPDDFNGNTNTYALLTCTSGSPMASYLFSWWHFGQSAYVPSAGQFKALRENMAAVNTGLKAVGGTPLAADVESGWYWTSTEVAGQEPYKAWLYSMASGTMHETPKNEPHRVRAVITVY